jgi:hypothetical protein
LRFAVAQDPSIALASFTLMLAVILIAEGVFQLITFFQLRVLPDLYARI